MKISVITPCLNSRRYIRQTIESVLSQKGDFELEYIIRDGCSTDGTLGILSDYKNQCIMFSQKGNSPQEAINAGIKMATVSPAIRIREYLSSFRRHNESISVNKFKKQFQKELEISVKYGNIMHKKIHTFNTWKIIYFFKKSIFGETLDGM